MPIRQLKVNHLIDQQRRQWRLLLVNVIFPQEVINLNLSIHIPKFSQPDRLVWKLEKKWSVFGEVSLCLGHGSVAVYTIPHWSRRIDRGHGDTHILK